MAALHCAPDSTLHNRSLLRLTRGCVPAADAGGVVVVDVAAAGDLSTVVRAEAVRLVHIVRVSDKIAPTS